MKRCCRSISLRPYYTFSLLSRKIMNLNNCHNRVIHRKQKSFFVLIRPSLALLLVIALGLAAAPACRKTPLQSGEPSLTAPSSGRDEEPPLTLPESAPLGEEEADRFALILASPLEAYDLLRPGGAVDPGGLEAVEIIRVVDGDTLIVMRDGRPERLRLIGLDAPESYAHHEEDRRTHRGESVSRIVTAWLTDRPAYLQFDKERTDPYDRLLAYVWLDAHTMVNEVLVREGLAVQHRYPPNTRYNDYFEELEARARREGRGIWSNGKSSAFAYDEESTHKKGGEHMKEKTIYLAGGCFWGVERYYQLLKEGVLETETGYANGTSPNPTYREVCQGDTGYAETVRLVFDPERLPLRAVLAHFFRLVDPTTRDHQGNDYGDQYRPGIYYTDPEDFERICDYIDARRKDYRRPIVIEVRELVNFYPAEDFHQNYLLNNPSGYCHVDLSQVTRPLSPDELLEGGAEAVQGGDRLDPSLFESNLPGPQVSASYDRPPDEVLRGLLTDLQYRVTRENETERPFSNAFDAHFEAGLYVDVISGEPLFSSRDKYDAGCGWPAFSRPVARGALVYLDDTSLWRKRVEVRSGGADSHLGHVFHDGPQDLGGLRYCINSAALRFIPLADMEKEGYGDWIDEVKPLEP